MKKKTTKCSAAKIKMPRDDDDDADDDVDAERASYVDVWESLMGLGLGVGCLQSAEGRESGAGSVSAAATLLWQPLPLLLLILPG